MKNVLILLFIIFFSYIQANAQSGKPTAKDFKRYKSDFFAGKTGSHFPNIDTLTPLNGQPFYFGKINKPTMIYFGFAGCTPCHFALPLLMETATEEKYKGYNFIYITYDNQQTLNDELKKDANKVKGLKMMHMDRDLIRDDRITFGFPTFYFVNSDGIISFADSGGSTSDTLKTLNEWHAHLDALK